MKQLLALLQLGAPEEKLYLALREQGKATIANLARQTSLPRSTVVDALGRLHTRRLVRPVRQGARTLWKAVADVTLARKLTASLDELKYGTSTQSPIGIRVSRQASVHVFSGRQVLLDMYLKTFQKHRKERVHSIQSAASARAALASDPTSFVPVNEVIRAQEIIMEGVVSKNMFELYKEQDVDWIQSMRGRLSALRYVEEADMSFRAEMVLFQDEALLMNWTDEVGLHIQQSDILDLLQALYRLMYRLGKPIEQESLLRTLADREVSHIKNTP